MSAGITPNQIMVYMLIGFELGETHADRDYRRRALRDFGVRPYPMPHARCGRSRSGASGEELVAFQRWCIQRKDEYVSWDEWWGKAKGNPRKLGDRVTLPLFPEAIDDMLTCACDQDPDFCPVHPNCICGCPKHAHRDDIGCFRGKMTCECKRYVPKEDAR